MTSDGGVAASIDATYATIQRGKQADPLRAAIARDCPHRLDDYDRHRARFDAEPTVAFRVHWWAEHHISADPALEQQIGRLYRQAADSSTRDDVLRLTGEASRLWGDIQQQVIKEMDLNPKETS